MEFQQLLFQHIYQDDIHKNILRLWQMYPWNFSLQVAVTISVILKFSENIQIFFSGIFIEQAQYITLRHISFDSIM